MTYKYLRYSLSMLSTNPKCNLKIALNLCWRARRLRVPVYRHVYGLVCRHVFGHANKHVYGHVHGRMYKCMCKHVYRHAYRHAHTCVRRLFAEDFLPTTFCQNLLSYFASPPFLPLVYRHLYRHVCMDMRADTCMDTCYRHMYRHVSICNDMCVDIRI